MDEVMVEVKSETQELSKVSSYSKDPSYSETQNKIKPQEFSESQEPIDLLINAANLTSGVVPLEIEKIDIKEVNKESLFYKDNKEFNSPVLIRGTKKQFVPSHSLVFFKEPSKDKFELVRETCQNVDETLALVTIPNISELKIRSIMNGMMVLEHTTTRILYVLRMPGTSKAVIPFKQISKILGIPYGYSKKNPAFLNEVNFQYWSEALAEVQDQRIPIDIVYVKDPILIDLKEDTEGFAQYETLSVYNVAGIFKAKVINKGKGVKEVIHSTLDDRVPLWSSVLTNINDEIHACDPYCEVKLQSYSLGYDGDNKGRHYTRLLLDEDDGGIKIGDDTFSLCINLESDFSGSSQDFGATNIDVGFFREVCSNGVGVVWNEEQRKIVESQYVTNFMESEGVVVGDQKYPEYLARAESKFKSTFSLTGIVVSNSVANKDMGNSQIQVLIRSLLESKEYIKGQIEALTTPFPIEMEEENFVNVVLKIGQELQLSPELIKFFIIEFISGNMINEQKFQTPLDCMNYISFMAKAYDSDLRMHVENNAYRFATVLASALIYNVKTKNETYLRYKSMVHEDLISGL